MNGPEIGKTTVIDGIRLVCTCSIAPEQYDAVIGKEKVGYLRLRHGHFTVAAPNVGGEIVYEATPEGDAAFEDNERAQFLAEAVRALRPRIRAPEPPHQSITTLPELPLRIASKPAR